jgi:hypothetical protein
MKINLTVQVSNSVRQLIGQVTIGKKTRDGLATRQQVIDFIRLRLGTLNDACGEWLRIRELTSEEKCDAADAIDYLKKCGKTDSEIRSWLLKQRARAEFDARS